MNCSQNVGTPNETIELDVAIVGAGCAGLFALYYFPRLGLSARVFEAGSGVGGTWHWNRYPGARVDIESLEYSFAFSEELQQDWEWTERYASQPELLKYFNFVADRFDLRKDIQLNTRINSIIFDETSRRWTLKTSSGQRVSAKYCIMATGFLSAPNKPSFQGVESFRGNLYHSGEWPHERVDFTGQRVAVIGTGSSGVQMIPIIATQAAHLHVFQRTPVYAVPARNHPMSAEYQAKVKANYGQWRYLERYRSFQGIVAVNYEPVAPTLKSALEVSAEERRALYEDRWKSGGLAVYQVYPDVYTNQQANDTLAQFVREKIRERVDDPAIADRLMPHFPILTKRVAADTGYYETFNRGNVTLVDIQHEPISEFTPEGIRVGDKLYEFDSIVFATGFDAITGAVNRMDIRGRGGITMKEHWAGGARSNLGLMSAGFPNMFFISGPGSPAPLYQPMLLCEEQTGWVGECISFLRRYKFECIEPTPTAEDNWGRICTASVDGTLFSTVKSWYVGANVPGKSSVGLCYFAGGGNYRRQCAEAAANGYADFVLTN